MKTNELEERVIDFAVSIVNIVEEIKQSYAGNYYGNQLIRSSGSPALNYGEARSAESHKDFVHKMGICLKELRESHNCLKIMLCMLLSSFIIIKINEQRLTINDF